MEMTEATVIDDIKADIVQQLSDTLRELNTRPVRWTVKGALGFNQLRVNLEAEIIEPRLAKVADFNYSPLYHKDEYIVIAYQLQSDHRSPVGLAVLNNEPGIETFIEASLVDIVNWIISSESEIDTQIELIPQLYTLVEKAQNLFG